jgi:subtilisin family serine protease
MKKIVTLSLALFITATFTFAQQDNKLTLNLHHAIKNSPDANSTITVLVKGNLAEVKNYLRNNNGSVRYSAGDISSVTLPLSRLEELSSKSFVSAIDGTLHHYAILNDTMRRKNNVDECQQGMLPLNQPYNGSGVIMGFIDTGIDFMHPDFLDSLGYTRIKWIWDHRLPVASNTPPVYNYGQQWDAAGIDSGAAAAHSDVATYGHGTYVAGIGAGNGRGVGHFSGVATESDIIMVAYDESYTGTVHRIADAVHYMVDKAAALGKPLVINASIGDYYGSHDGKDLEAQMINNLITSRAGIIMVAASGNLGGYPFHLGRNTVAGDTSFTWFKYNAGYGAAYTQLFANTTNFTNVRFAIGVDKVTPDYSFRGRTNFSGIASHMAGITSDTIYNGGNRIGIVQMLGSYSSAGVYSMEFYILADSTTYNWRLITTGNGHFDSWSFDYEWTTIPSDSVFPDIAHYVLTDTNSTMTSSFACLSNVITVGNYYNTDRHVDVDTVLQISPNDHPDDLAENSSRGPTRDGRIKPEITASGHHIISCGVLSTMPAMIAAQPYKVALGGMHVTGGGTSAAAPVVAGTAALYLQKNPTATITDFRTALFGCSKNDQYTWGPLPNNAWGYGKTDAFLTLLCTSTTIEESDANLPANVYPNPFSSYTTIYIDTKHFSGDGVCRITDAFGKEVQRNTFTGNKVFVQRNDLKAGVYFFEVHSKANSKETIVRGKLVVED